MSLSDAEQVLCPYCGQFIEVVLDPSAGAQEYVEDCPRIFRQKNPPWAIAKGRKDKLFEFVLFCEGDPKFCVSGQKSGDPCKTDKIF